MKTEFELVWASGHRVTDRTIKIGRPIEKGSKPYVSMNVYNSEDVFIQDKDLERFAVNILKAIKSKKLK